MLQILFNFCLYIAFFLALTCPSLYAEVSGSKLPQGFIDRLIVKYGDQVFTQKEIEQTYAVAKALVQKNMISDTSIADTFPKDWRGLVEHHSFFLTTLAVAKTSSGYRPTKEIVDQTTDTLRKSFPNLRSLKRLVRQWLWVNQLAKARQRQGQTHFHQSRWFKRAHSKVRKLYYSGAFHKRG